MLLLSQRRRALSAFGVLLAALSVGACGSPPGPSSLTSGRVRGPTPDLSDRLGNGALLNEVPGRLNLAQVRGVVAAHKGDVRACYQRETKNDPTLEGEIVLSWEILNDGVVSAPMIARVTLDDQALEDCLLGAIRKWRFPASDSQTSVETYRFDFPP